MKRYVLLLCHSYDAPFLSVAVQYASFFKDSPYRVITVFIKGAPSSTVAEQIPAEEVIFLNATSSDLNGLKRGLINKIRSLHKKYNFSFAIAHRYKAIYLSTHVKQLFVIGVAHIDGVFSPFFRKLYIRLKQRNLALLGVSQAISNDIKKALPFFPDNKCHYLYNSLNLKNIKQHHLPKKYVRDALQLSHDKFLFLNVGRLHPDKDQSTLIRAFAVASKDMPNAQLAIIGFGRLDEQLKQLVASLSLQDKVIFLGKVPNAINYMQGFDSFILSSIREGLPVALLEAFAADLICIATRCNGNEEAIESVGYSFEIGDVNALAHQMKTVYSMDENTKRILREKMQNKFRENYTEEAVRETFWQLPFLKPILDRA